MQTKTLLFSIRSALFEFDKPNKYINNPTAWMNIKKFYIVCASGILEKARSELLPPPDLSTQCLENNKKGIT